tara:strand:+ start:110 stop:535 length:426 start_codon:yes stop_codon:yes gene_type:complete
MRKKRKCSLVKSVTDLSKKVTMNALIVEQFSKMKRMMNQNYLAEVHLEELHQVVLQEAALQAVHLEAVLQKAHLEGALQKAHLEVVLQKAPQEVDLREVQASLHHPLLNQVVHQVAHEKVQAVAHLQEALQKDQNEALLDD